MNNALEFLRARFEGERNALAERVSLAKTVQQPGQSIVEYGSSIRKNARHCAYPAGYTDQAMRDVFVAEVSSESVRELESLGINNKNSSVLEDFDREILFNDGQYQVALP